MSIKIAINGFGRIGRSVFKNITDNNPDLEVVAINDLTDVKTLTHLLKYDSVYGKYDKTINAKVLAEKDPLKLPWKDLDVDIVLECTGFFTDFEGANKHILAGAKKVIISAPSKSDEISHFVMGVNQDKFNTEKNNIVSMCSCTTNCLAPIAKIIHENFEIENGLMTTMHSYTNDQRLLDAPHRDLRRARAAGLSMVPTTTGAAIAVTKAYPELEGKIHGMAVRVPTPVVSLVDFVVKVKKDTTVEEINNIFEKASNEELKGILNVENDMLVSVDYVGNPFSAIVDMKSTMVQGGNLIKVLAWYDNEWGYAYRLAEFAQFIGNKLK